MADDLFLFSVVSEQTVSGKVIQGSDELREWQSLKGLFQKT